MNDDYIYEKAEKKVKAKKGFFYHFISYVGVLGLLYAIMNNDGHNEILPVIIVALSWGIGIAIHYFAVFGTQHLEFLGFNPNWEEEEMEKEIERLQRKRELGELLEEEELQLKEMERLELKHIEKRKLDRD